MATIKKTARKMQMGGGINPMMKMGGKAKNGKSFPDLNKDGKITKADVLKGRGVIAKKGTMISKAQKGKKLLSGASSVSAEKDYAKSDSLRNVANKMTGKDFFEMARLKKSNPRQQSDSLRMEGDRKTKATGGVPKQYRFKAGGKMKTGGKMTKKCKYGCY
jgi:hypothetical protein